ncbi:MAG: tyrosine-type recombinase/integrase [Peptococcia bacterium]
MATHKKHVSKSGEVSYYIRSFDGRDINGKQIEKTMTWKPAPGMTERQIEKELERQKVLFDEKVKKGFILDGATRFVDYANVWMKNNEPPQLAPKTYERYKSLLVRINIAIGHIKLEKLQSHHLQAFYKMLVTEGAKAGTTKAVAKVNLDDILKSKKLSKAFVARTAEIAPATVGAACKGKNITLESAQAISKVLEKEMDSLFKIEQNDAGLSDKTVLHHHRLISSILGQATRERIIPFNVADRQYMKAPKVEHKEANFLDDVQAQEVIDKLFLEPMKWRTALLLLIFTGMRRGELMGLEWKDIDFDNSLIYIRRTSQYVSGLGIICKDTKNKSSNRVMKVTEEVLDFLTEYRTWWLTGRLKVGDRWHNVIEVKDAKGTIELRKNDRLFVQEDGTPMNPDSVTDWTEKFVKRHNLPKFSPHSLRHTNITLQIENGVPLRNVAARAGHANTATTSKIYSHVIKAVEERQAEVISDALGLNLKKEVRHTS